MMRLRFYTIFLFLAFAEPVFSCDCPPISKLNADYTKQYDLIFRGRVKSVGECGKESIAVFIIDKLFKGQVPIEFNVAFDCKSSCMMNFGVGQDWIIYSKMVRVDKAHVTVCSRSRQNVKRMEEDMVYLTSGESFDDEDHYLTRNLGIQKYLNPQSKNFTEPMNQLPDGKTSLILVLVSVVGLISINFLVAKWRK